MRISFLYMITKRTSLNFRDIYNEDYAGDFLTLFDGIDEKFALGFIQHLNFYQNLYKTTEGCLKFLRENWFSHTNAETYLSFVDKIEEWKRRFPTDEIVIFNAPSNLTFFEALIQYLQTPHTNDLQLSNPEKEIALLKAYLQINSTKAKPSGFEEIEQNYPDEIILWTLFSKPFQYADLVNRDLLEFWQIETFKAIKLFEYFEKDNKTNTILAKLLEDFECDSWRTYLKASAGMAIPTLDTPNYKGNNYIEVDPELPFHNVINKIISQIGVDPIEANIQEDHLYLRTKPIYSTGESKFQVIYKRFFVEKIFRSLYFQLSKINDDLEVMTRAGFRNKIYTSGFSENTLLYTVLNKIFEGSAARLEGNKVEIQDPYFGGSDYLSSALGNLFIFESKDILIRKEVKENLIVPQLRTELRLKFYKDGNSDKAVLQLAKNVKKVLEHQYGRFGFSPGKYRFIYPIIVVHSDAFNTPALNQILIKWFKEACSEAGLTKDQLYKVRQVVLVDITTLTYFHEHLGKKGTNLNEIIDMYLDYTKFKYNDEGVPQLKSMEQMIPFSAFLNQYIRKKKKVRTSRWIIDTIHPVIL